MNWEEHRFGNAVECRVATRPMFNGRAAKPSCVALDGKTLMLEALWLMGDEDPYPGEWALSTVGSVGGLYQLAGITWIASGDVTPNVI